MYVYVWIYLCELVYLYECICTYMYVCMIVCMCVCLCCMSVYICMCDISVRIYKNTHKVNATINPVSAHMYVCFFCMYIWIHVCMYIILVAQVPCQPSVMSAVRYHWKGLLPDAALIKSQLSKHFVSLYISTRRELLPTARWLRWFERRSENRYIICCAPHYIENELL